MTGPITQTFFVGKTRCVMTWMPNYGLSVVWEPEQPVNLTDKEWKQYRAGRAGLLEEIARQVGGTVALVEPGAGANVEIFGEKK